MSQENAVSQSGFEPERVFSMTTWRNCLLSLLVPGLGYYLTGRKKTFYIMSACLYGAFILALIQGGDIYEFSGEGKIRGIGAVCQLGMGIPYLIVKTLVEAAVINRGTPLNVTYDYGTGYFLIAGMINWLSVMDIFDISVRRK